MDIAFLEPVSNTVNNRTRYISFNLELNIIVNMFVAKKSREFIRELYGDSLKKRYLESRFSYPLDEKLFIS